MFYNRSHYVTRVKRKLTAAALFFMESFELYYLLNFTKIYFVYYKKLLSF